MARPRILLLRFSSLGDVILATAAIEVLASGAPEADLHVLTKPAFRDVFRGNPHVTSILEWDPSAENMGALARRLRKGRYDWIVDLHANLRARVLRLLVRNARWTGYRKGVLARRAALWSRRAALLPRTHVVDRYIAALRPLGVPLGRRLPRVWPGAEERATAERQLLDGGWTPGERLIVLAPGARWATKMWPRDHWSALLRGVAEEELGFPVVIGGRAERELCASILNESGNSRGANLAGATSILESAAALQKAAAPVTNDSATLHLATAVGTPVVALFGPTARGFGFFPLGPRDVLLERDLDCRPCSLHGSGRCPRGHHRCLTEIEPSHVLAHLRRIALEPLGGSPDNPPALAGS